MGGATETRTLLLGVGWGGGYLGAAEAGADDGAIVVGGAEGTPLACHPEEVEGAAVAGAVGAFAGVGGGGTKRQGGFSQRGTRGGHP